jgi:hypothetical protein
MRLENSVNWYKSTIPHVMQQIVTAYKACWNQAMMIHLPHQPPFSSCFMRTDIIIRLVRKDLPTAPDA